MKKCLTYYSYCGIILTYKRNTPNKHKKGGENMANMDTLMRIHKRMIDLPDEDIEKLELIVKGMLLAQKSQQSKKDDEKSA